jgi:hypothetical protein
MSLHCRKKIATFAQARLWRGLAVLGGTLAMAGFAAAAPAYEVPAPLVRVASEFALHEVDVHCPSSEEWAADAHAATAWSYANLRGDYVALHPTLCMGALNVGDPSVPAWVRAAGVLGLAHESFHLRPWRYRRDEGRVACQAIVHFRNAAQLLGATAELAEELLPYALALHWRTARLFPLYNDRTCRVPIWRPPELPGPAG